MFESHKTSQEDATIESQQRLEYFVDNSQEGTYLTVPFTMPENVETFKLSYQYERHQKSKQGSFTARQEINIIDLGILDVRGVQVGASGSDKTEIEIGETIATPGYQPWPLVAGQWQIILGAYKVAKEGVLVTYELTFIPKRMRLLKGDFHTHTIGSDGVLTVQELAQHALKHGLDYLAITDHNQMVSSESLPQLPELTLIPGIEWTHYLGHANFLGVDKPYDEPFFTNTFEGVQARFASARQRGALITINHPFDETCGFQFDIHALPYDCMEIWNGPMRESNFRALWLWHSLLVSGKKIPICGGSDYHRDHLFLFPGAPCTCVYTMSRSPADILTALKQGHAYITFAPNGPTLTVKAGDYILGDSVPFSTNSEVDITANHLLAGDVVQVVTAQGTTPLLRVENDGKFSGSYSMKEPGFARIEILRSFLPGLPMLPALISNPVYFDAESR